MLNLMNNVISNSVMNNFLCMSNAYHVFEEYTSLIAEKKNWLFPFEEALANKMFKLFSKLQEPLAHLADIIQSHQSYQIHHSVIVCQLK